MAEDNGNKVTVLDKEFLKTFLRENITEFKNSLGRIVKNSPEGTPSMETLVKGATKSVSTDSPTPLAVGSMAGEGTNLHGGELNQAVRKVAEEIDALIVEHQVMFEDLESALEETIEEMRKTQHSSLEKISADMFVELFEDVEDNATAGSRSNSDTDG